MAKMYILSFDLYRVVKLCLAELFHDKATVLNLRLSRDILNKQFFCYEAL